MTKSYMEILRNCFLFSSLPSQIQDMLFSELKVQNFKKADEIYTRTKFQKSLGIILEGEAAVYKDNALLNTLKPGSCFGAAAVFSESEEYVTLIKAEKNCAIIFISAEKLKEYFARFPDMALHYISFLSGRIQFLNKKIDSFTSPSVEGALWNWLWTHSRESRVEITEGYAALARELNVSRASLYRALSKLEAQNKIVKSGAEIKICSP